MRALFLSAVCALGIVACGGATSGPGGGSSTVNGTVAGGQKVPTNDAIGVVSTQTQTVGTSTVTTALVGVAITNKANVCEIAQAHHVPANATILSLSVTKPGNAIAPGTYTLGSNGLSNTFVGAEYTQYGASCATSHDELGATGTITLTTVSASAVQGTFDVTMANGDHLTGSFDAPVCSLPTGSNNTNPTCES